MIVDMLSNEKLNPIVTELSIRGRNWLFLVFITPSYFTVPKDIRLNSKYYFISKIPNKRELTHIVSHNSSDTEYNDFVNLYKKCTSKPYPLPFRKNL